jgi:hypothetical protein
MRRLLRRLRGLCVVCPTRAQVGRYCQRHAIALDGDPWRG